METLQDKNSTIVRADSPSDDITDGALREPQASPPAEAAWLSRNWRFALLRAGMRGLSRVAPALAVELFDRVWFTPPRPRPNAEAARWLARGESMRFRVHGQPVRAWSWGKGPTVLLVHGWGGNAAQMRVLAEALLQRGLRVVAFDAPAHGRSGPSRLGGRRVSMIEIADALRVVAAGVGPLAGLVAHSGGCTAAGLALREGWAGPERAVFVAPFALPSQAVASFARAIGASAAVTSRFSQRVQLRFGRAWTDFDMTGLPSLRALPEALVVHDGGDREVPASHGRALAAAWPGARWQQTTGLGHRRLLRDPDVVSAIAGFIADGRAAAAPTPADARDELDRHFAAGCPVFGPC